MDEAAPCDWGWEEESDLGFGEEQRSALVRDEPRQKHHDEQQQRSNQLDEHLTFRSIRERDRSRCAASNKMAEKISVKVNCANHGKEQVFRLAQALQPHQSAIEKRRPLKIEESANHD